MWRKTTPRTVGATPTQNLRLTGIATTILCEESAQRRILFLSGWWTNLKMRQLLQHYLAQVTFQYIKLFKGSHKKEIFLMTPRYGTVFKGFRTTCTNLYTGYDNFESECPIPCRTFKVNSKFVSGSEFWDKNQTLITIKFPSTLQVTRTDFARHDLYLCWQLLILPFCLSFGIY